MYLLLLVVAGIIVADQIRPPAWLFLLTCLVLLTFGIALMERGGVRTVLLIFGISLFCFAGYHFSIKFYEFGPQHISRYVSEKKTFQVFGKVADWPDLKANRTEIKIAIDSLGREFHAVVKGSILLKISDSSTALQRGDRVEFQGTIYPLKSKSDPGSFDYARYLQLRGIFGIVYLPTLLDVRVDKSRRFGLIGLVDRIRAELVGSFKRNLSPVSAALASGILIGETRDIPGEIYERFRDSGTLHLLAVSGSNVALMVLFVILVLRPFSIKRKQRAIILITCVFIFALLSYGEPSVVRASLMAALVLLATIIERRFDLNQIIATAALIILLIDPAQLFNVGFQLSFVTAWGLVFITPKIANLFKTHINKFWFRWLVLPVIVSSVAQICSAPLIAYYFDKVPAISVVANMVIVPLVSISVVASLLLFVIDLIWPLLGIFFGSVLDWFMKSIFFFLEQFGEKNSVVIETADLSALSVILIYLFLVAVSLSLFNKMVRRIAMASALVILNIGLTFSLVNAASSDEVKSHLDIFNIPGGSAIIVNQSLTGSPDLIITGVVSRAYPMDERIFETALSGLGVNKIGRIFVLSAEYGAMDDIVRLSNKFGVRELFVDERLSRSFHDIANSVAFFDEGVKLRTFSGKISINSNPGIYPSNGRIVITLETAKILVVSKLNFVASPTETDKLPTAIVIGSSDNLDISVVEDLQKQGYAAVVCSKFVQSPSSFNSKGSMALIHSVDSQGPCRLYITESEAESFILKPIH